MWRRVAGSGTSLDYETGRPGFDSGSYPDKSKHAPRRCTIGKGGNEYLASVRDIPRIERKMEVPCLGEPHPTQKNPPHLSKRVGDLPETTEAVPDVTLVTEYQFVPSASTGQNTSLKCVVGGDFSGVEFSAERNWRLPAARSSIAAIDDASWPGRMVTFFPEGGLDRVGVFSSTVTFPDGEKVKVTTIGMSADADIYPKYFTVTANKGDSVTLYTQPSGEAQQADVRWRRNGFPLFGPNQFTLELTSLDPRFQPGVYECYYPSDFSENRHAISLLIIRACPEGLWGEECDLPCPACLNGGQCQVDTGECVCAPGFTGTTCRTPCGGNRFGRDCSFRCDESERDDPAGCSGHLFCLPEPYGCSCGPGFTGLLCQREQHPLSTASPRTSSFGNPHFSTKDIAPVADREMGVLQAGRAGRRPQMANRSFAALSTIDWTSGYCVTDCSPGTFGAGCQSTCHCSSIGPEACDRYTGECRDGCAVGWTGPNCQEGWPAEGVRHSHGCARCTYVVCTTRLAVSDCVHRTLRKW
ncbi:hypothetical protein Bbelb_056920 [Branchiostoma belcheri]|nr:hypothetical protein Bbelb_056920 [Branchiostoma belcheri]